MQRNTKFCTINILNWENSWKTFSQTERKNNGERRRLRLGDYVPIFVPYGHELFFINTFGLFKEWHFLLLPHSKDNRRFVVLAS